MKFQADNSSIILKQIGVVALISLSSLLIFTLLGIFLAGSLFGISPGVMQTDPASWSDKTIDAMRVVQVVASIGTFLFPALIISVYLKESPTGFLALNRKFQLRDIGFVLLFFIAAFPFIEWLIFLNSKMQLPSFLYGIETYMREKEDQATAITSRFLEATTLGKMCINLVVLALVPAICEEFFFRGMLQKLFLKWTNNATVAILTASFVFSAIHFQFYGFLPRMLLGIFLGYFFYWTGSIWPSVFYHFFNNSVAVVGWYLASKNIIDIEIDKPMNNSNLVTIISLAVFAAFFLILANYYNKRRKNKEKDWVKVFETSRAHEAEIIKSKLEENEIEAVILNKRDSSYVVFGPIEVYVKPEMVENANEVIKSVENEQSAETDD